MEDDD
jgi:hypothetical protein